MSWSLAVVQRGAGTLPAHIDTPRNIYQGPSVNTADLGLITNLDYRVRHHL